ncbi:hypothetical protein IQ260_30280 [Leptolyngbya cf. ectocarpi LEGE 11479]|uniref:Anti-sigma factor n=1 Tax=Leptolyngbya cf. ectocarpi LEGE 11479 TaxID=1828722 RepID=A0A929FDU1_LEPEC|nr:hypothetical protein [Leptolyngbya ectocarpi]MBE9070928.1 hypothetical protein [Leptolyngbya cf. ectocarpi LEGE 11479]
MTGSLSPQERQELVAGYVLGDLSSAEAEAFRVLLTEVPELQAEVTALQAALAMMPYGLDEVEPVGGLRSQILAAAQAELAPQRQPVPLKTRQPRSRLPWTMSTVAAALAMVCGLATLHLNHQVRSLQAQYPQSDLAQTWSGLSTLLQDHRQSLSNPDGPVDFVVKQPDEILALSTGFKTTVAALPLLPAQKGILLGGSNCQLGAAAGLRLTYQLETDQTVSAYQLVLAEEDFPELQAAHLTLQQPDGTGIVLWRDDNYLYAVVADLPTAELQTLAYAIEGI